MALDKRKIHNSAMLKPQIAKGHEHVYNEINKAGQHVCSGCGKIKE
jgi:uncharacterized Zn-finger protein